MTRLNSVLPWHWKLVTPCSLPTPAGMDLVCQLQQDGDRSQQCEPACISLRTWQRAGRPRSCERVTQPLTWAEYPWEHTLGMPASATPHLLIGEDEQRSFLELWSSQKFVQRLLRLWHPHMISAVYHQDHCIRPCEEEAPETALNGWAPYIPDIKAHTMHR